MDHRTDVKGYSVQNEKISLLDVFNSFAYDGLFIGSAFNALTILTQSRLTHFFFFPLFLAFFLYFGIFISLNRSTFSQVALGIKPINSSHFLYQKLRTHFYFESSRRRLFPVLTITLFLFTGYEAFKNQILFRKSEVLQIQSFSPASKDWSDSEWAIAPFFYAIGGWPRTFQNVPIFYSVPYASGPPNRFIGKIATQWVNPTIRLIFEGPKTPRMRRTPSELKACLQSSSLSCLWMKESLLQRHFDEMKDKAIFSFHLEWFETIDSPLAEYLKPQGIHLSALREKEIEDRFILVNEKGIHQSLILKRPLGKEGELAYSLVLKSLGSIRLFPSLEPGKVWVNHELRSTELSQLQSASHESRAKDLQAVQILLLSKISVEPSSYDAFFHLAGTALMLTQKSIRSQDGKNVAALENIRSAYRFAQDLSPEDPRTSTIQNYWLESRNY